VIDSSALQMVLMVLTSWLERRERSALAYLIEENRLLRRQLGGRRFRFTDDDRRRLAGLAHRVGRAALRDRHGRHARHTAAMASTTHCAEMDVRRTAGPSWCSCGNLTTCGPDGD